MGVERTQRGHAATAESETHLCHSTINFAVMHSSVFA